LAKSGSDVTLSWGGSCDPADSDYEIYEGALGSFSSRTSVVCGTGSATNWQLTPSAGSRYYLVVPRSSNREGSYGVNSAGNERPPANAACLAQALAPPCS